jgi:hypothetical protein
LRSKPDQPSPSVEVAGEELAKQKEVKLADVNVEAVAVASGAEAAAAPAPTPAPAPAPALSLSRLHLPKRNAKEEFLKVVVQKVLFLSTYFTLSLMYFNLMQVTFFSIHIDSSTYCSIHAV